MVVTAEGVPERRGMRAWWSALAARNRERVVLGTLVGAAVATRDVVLFSFAAGLFTLLEISDVASAPNAPQPA